MKMFLTRMGQNARIVVTGDITQVDLPQGTRSGLADAIDRLKDIPGVGTALLDRSDIVRHPLVQSIVNAYELSEMAGERDAKPASAPADSSGTASVMSIGRRRPESSQAPTAAFPHRFTAAWPAGPAARPGPP